MKLSSWWPPICRRAHVVFPPLAGLTALVILTSPLYPEPLGFVSGNPFARFSLFWVMSVCVVMSTANNPLRPSIVALGAGMVALVIGFLFCFICVQARGALPDPVGDMVLSCLAGAVLGALAGTWLLYVFSVCTDRR